MAESIAGTVAIKVNADASGVKSGVGEASAHLSKLGSVMETLKHQTEHFGGAMKVALLGATGLGAFTAMHSATEKGVEVLGEWIHEALAMAKAQKMLQAELMATGHAARLSAAEISEFAEHRSGTTNFMAHATVSSAARMASFPNISGHTFEHALKAAQDLATVMDTDLMSATMAISKMLNDPESGMRAAKTMGISFTKEFMDSVKKEAESGRIDSAQSMILSEMDKRYGGMAESMANPFTQLRNAIVETGEQLAKNLVPNIRLAAMSLLHLLGGARDNPIPKGDIGGDRDKRFDPTRGVLGWYSTRAWDLIDVGSRLGATVSKSLAAVGLPDFTADRFKGAKSVSDIWQSPVYYKQLEIDLERSASKMVQSGAGKTIDKLSLSTGIAAKEFAKLADAMNRLGEQETIGTKVWEKVRQATEGKQLSLEQMMALNVSAMEAVKRLEQGVVNKAGDKVQAYIDQSAITGRTDETSAQWAEWKRQKFVESEMRQYEGMGLSNEALDKIKRFVDFHAEMRKEDELAEESQRWITKYMTDQEKAAKEMADLESIRANLPQDVYDRAKADLEKRMNPQGKESVQSVGTFSPYALSMMGGNVQQQIADNTAETKKNTKEIADNTRTKSSEVAAG